MLIGSPTNDVLDGGGGTDVLEGGDGNDVLTDGDRDGGGSGLGPDADTMDGGPGIDTLSYAQRTDAVTVDLARNGPVGEPGEGDAASGFEWITGGKGNDRLAGDRRANIINGGGGRNWLSGRQGNDILEHASGWQVRCGRVFDTVRRPRANTHVRPGCERLLIPAPPRTAIVDTDA